MFYSAVNIIWEIFAHAFKYFQKHFQFNYIICDNLISESVLLVDIQAGARFCLGFFFFVIINNTVRLSMGIKLCMYSFAHFFDIKS